VRVILADDHQLMREGLRAVLEKAQVQVLGEAANGREALAKAKRLRPDVVIMDIGMPELNGIDATRRLLAEVPGVKVIALSMNDDRRYVSAMLEAGASGYVLKSSASEELLTALQAAVSGKTYLSRALRGSPGDPTAGLGSSSLSGPDCQLSTREREVLQLIAEGKSSKEIAAALGIAVTTVETHRRHLSEKLDLHTIAALTKYAVRQGLTSGRP